MEKSRRDELNILIKAVVFRVRDIAQNEFDNNANATGMSGSHGNLDKRIGRLLREFKNTISENQVIENVTLGNIIEVNYVKEKLISRAKKFEHDGRDKNHPFK